MFSRALHLLLTLVLVLDVGASPHKFSQMKEAKAFTNIWKATSQSDGVTNCVISTAKIMWHVRFGVDTGSPSNLPGTFLKQARECCLLDSDRCATRTESFDHLKCHDEDCAQKEATKLFNRYEDKVYRVMEDHGLVLEMNDSQRTVLQQLPLFVPDIVRSQKYHIFMGGYSKILLRASGMAFFDVSLLESPAFAIFFHPHSKRVCADLIKRREKRMKAKKEETDDEIKRQVQQEFQMWRSLDSYED